MPAYSMTQHKPHRVASHEVNSGPVSTRSLLAFCVIILAHVPCAIACQVSWRASSVRLGKDKGDNLTGGLRSKPHLYDIEVD